VVKRLGTSNAYVPRLVRGIQKKEYDEIIYGYRAQGAVRRG
jgi:hypothetical protein